jgi:hypothetical protein
VPLSATTLSWLAVLSLAIGLLALVAGCVAWSRAASVQARARRPRRSTKQQPASPLSSAEVTEQIEALQLAASSSLRHLAVVRYDAFGDMGGHLSWSMALLDDAGDGVVLTSIHGRSDSRTYAKNVSTWTANQQLSPEETEAISFARSGDR